MNYYYKMVKKKVVNDGLQENAQLPYKFQVNFKVLAADLPH